MDRISQDSEKPLGREEPKRLGNVTSLADVRRNGFVPYNLGVLYSITQFEYEIPARFAGDTGAEIFGGTMDFPHQLLPSCRPPHDRRLCFMDEDHFETFVDYMHKLQLLDNAASTFYQVVHVKAAIQDPFQVSRNEKPTPETLDMFTVSGMLWRLLPKTHIEMLETAVLGGKQPEEMTFEDVSRLPQPTTAPRSINLIAVEPDPQVVRIGSGLLGISN